MALTATASSETQAAICKSLCLNEPAIVSQSVDRPNIYLSAGPKKELTVCLCVSLLRD